LPKDYYDDEEIPLEAVISGPGARRVTAVDFHVHLDMDGTKQDVDRLGVPADGFPRVATWKFQPPPVPTELPYYDLRYDVAAKGATAKASVEQVRVWPREVGVDFTSTDLKSHLLVPFSIVRLGVRSSQRATKAGLWRGRLIGEFTIEVERPFRVSDETLTGPRSHRRTMKVVREDIVARFISPDPKGLSLPVKQYVNLGIDTQWSKQFPHGHKIEFEIGTVDDMGRRGDVIHIACSFGRESARTTPQPALLATGLAAPPVAADSNRSYTGRIVLGEGGRAKFSVELGLAGGDTTTVKLGATSACDQASLSFVNWRRIDYQSWMPLATGSERLSDYAFLRHARDARLSDAMTSYMDSTFGAAFVEFRPIEGRVGFFERGKVVGIEHAILDAALFPPGDPGKRVLVLTEEMLSAIRDERVGPFDQRPRSVMSLLWTDFIAIPESWKQNFTALTGPATDLVTTRSVFARTVDRYPSYSQSGGYSGTRWNAGDLALTLLRWRVTGVWNDATAVYDPPPPGGTSDWHAIKKREAIHALLEFIEHKKLRVNAALPGELGQLFTIEHTYYKEISSGDYVTLEIELTGLAYGLGTYASALRGDVSMSLQWGFPHRPLASTILHEAGHNMGMAYINRTKARNEKTLGTDAKISDTDVSFGRPDSSEIPGIPFPTSWVEGGVTYVGRSHTGPHCASGVTASGPANGATLVGDMGGTAEAEYTCIMYGGGDMRVDKAYSFCPDCQTHIRGEDLRDIRKNWWP
jgi:hypothetical protein